MPVREASGAGRAAPQRHANTQKGKGPRVVRLRRAAGGSPAARIGYAYLNNSERAKPAFLDLMSCFTLKSIRTKKNAYYPFPKKQEPIHASKCRS